MRGRPRSFEKQSDTFLRLYLDPLMSPEAICQACGIGLATFYNYEKELNLPKLRVGIENQNATLPRQKALTLFSSRVERYELKVVRNLAKLLKARVKLIPCLALDANAAINAVKAKHVDFALAAISWTRKRSQEMYFSDSYNPEFPPSGVLMRLKRTVTSSLKAGALRPRLGVNEASVHQEYATDVLQNDFEIHVFKNVQPTLQALLSGKIDFVLLHPDWLEDFPTEATSIEICSKPFYYRSHTGIIFHSDSEQWRKPVNQAISQLLEEWYNLSLDVKMK
jgi:ABC-type amino acid transport substrate-binding protein